MADDIREARQMVIGAVLSYADACERDVQPSKIAMALKAVDDAFDALIAAVRAENAICSCGTTMICPDIGCDKHKRPEPVDIDAAIASLLQKPG